MAAPTAADPLADPRLDLILDQLHDLRRLVMRITTPVEVLDLPAAAARLGRSVRWMEGLLARGVFTDPRGAKVRGSKRLVYADELSVYLSDGEDGVVRFRRELGRGV